MVDCNNGKCFFEILVKRNKRKPCNEHFPRVGIQCDVNKIKLYCGPDSPPASIFYGI